MIHLPYIKQSQSYLLHQIIIDIFLVQNQSLLYEIMIIIITVSKLSLLYKTIIVIYIIPAHHNYLPRTRQIHLAGSQPVIDQNRKTDKKVHDDHDIMGGTCTRVNRRHLRHVKIIQNTVTVGRVHRRGEKIFSMIVVQHYRRLAELVHNATRVFCIGGFLCCTD